MKEKSFIPYDVLKSLESFLAINSQYVEIHFAEKNHFVLKPKDELKEYYFSISIMAPNERKYLVDYKPCETGSGRELLLTGAEIELELKRWNSILGEISKMKIPGLDDPILTFYKNELAKKFIILEDDADKVPFQIDRQLWLTEQTSLMEQAIKKSLNDENKEEGQELIKEVKELRASIPKLTKQKVVDKLVVTLAKMWRFSFNVFNKVAVNMGEEFIKGLIGKYIG